jgi:hypothetical protein
LRAGYPDRRNPARFGGDGVDLAFCDRYAGSPFEESFSVIKPWPVPVNSVVLPVSPVLVISNTTEPDGYNRPAFQMRPPDIRDSEKPSVLFMSIEGVFYET